MTAYLDESDRARLDEADPRWQLVEAEMRAWLRAHGYGDGLVCTSWWRDDGGVHSTGRARDYRVWAWGPEDRHALAAHLSEVFRRRSDDRYETAIYETPETHPRATGPHLHVQLPAYPTPWWVGALVLPPRPETTDEREWAAEVSTRPPAPITPTTPPADRPEDDLQEEIMTMFHVADGWYAGRREGGSVRIVQLPEPRAEDLTYPSADDELPAALADLTLDPSSWASVVASVSAPGETNDAFGMAEALHAGETPYGVVDGVVGLDLADIEALEPGPKGYQIEPGFHLIGGEEGIGAIVVPTVRCASDRDPTPQDRYLSPYELERGRLEVADHMACVRIQGELVVGRRDDIAEVGGRVGRGLLARLGRSLRRRLAGLIEGAVKTLGGRLP